MTSKDPLLPIPLINFIRQNSSYSRREILNKIINGHVKINENVICDSKIMVLPTDRVCVDQLKIVANRKLYYKFNKPIDVISTFHDPNQRHDLMTYLKKSRLPDTLKPIGRLDRQSSGLLLFSNDGDFIQTVLHPQFLVSKEYEIVLNRPLKATDQTKLEHGFFLDDGPVKIQFKDSFSKTQFLVSIHMGRNRILRRSFDYFGYTITTLHRTAIGRIELGNLKKRRV